jgi:hypothetical protein
MHEAVHKLLIENGYLQLSRKLCNIYNKYRGEARSISPGCMFLTLDEFKAISEDKLLEFCILILQSSRHHIEDELSIQDIKRAMGLEVIDNAPKSVPKPKKVKDKNRNTEDAKDNKIKSIIGENRALRAEIEELKVTNKGLLITLNYIKTILGQTSNILDQY